jgi:hypothetical protein
LQGSYGFTQSQNQGFPAAFVDVTVRRDHIAGMTELTDTELEQFGRDVAREVVGADKVKQIEVVTGPNWDGDPSHYFWYQLEQDPDWRRAADARVRLRLRLWEELAARGDTGLPYTRVLNEQEWPMRKGG